MTISKLNKKIKNKGEQGYEASPINKTLLQDMCDKTDEVIEDLKTYYHKKFALNQNASTEYPAYYLLATVPPTSTGNGSILKINGVLGSYPASNKASIDVMIANREGLKVIGNYIGSSTAFNYADIAIYEQEDGSLNIYYVKLAQYTGGVILDVNSANVTLDCSGTSVTPVGTLKEKIGKDTLGWKDLDLESGISVGSIVKKAQYKKVGNTVYIRGDVTGITKENTTIATLPEGCRPSAQIFSVNAVNGKRYARIWVNSAGKLTLEWTSDDTYNLAWYSINMSYIVD